MRAPSRVSRVGGLALRLGSCRGRCRAPVRHRHHGRTRAVLKHLRPRLILLRVLLAKFAEARAVARATHAGAPRVHHHKLQTLRAHHRAQAAARGVTRRVAVVLVGGRHRRAAHSHFARRPAANERRARRVRAVKVEAQRVVALHFVVVGGDDARAFMRNLKPEARLRVRRLAADDDGANAELHQVLPRLPARVRLLDAAGERAFAAHREPPRSGRRAAGKHAGREHQHVVGAERVARRVAFVEQNLGGERAPAEQLPTLGEIFERCALRRHVDAENFVGLGKLRHVVLLC